MKQKKKSVNTNLMNPYFGAKRVRGKRGRGAVVKTPVFGLLKRSEKVFVTIVPNCTKETLMPINRGLILEQSTIYTDGWKTYNGLVLIAMNTTWNMSPYLRCQSHKLEESYP